MRNQVKTGGFFWSSGANINHGHAQTHALTHSRTHARTHAHTHTHTHTHMHAVVYYESKPQILSRTLNVDPYAAETG